MMDFVVIAFIGFTIVFISVGIIKFGLDIIFLGNLAKRYEHFLTKGIDK